MSHAGASAWDVKGKSIVVGGGGGFIGGHMVSELLRRGARHVRVVDIKPLTEWHQVHEDAENLVADLKSLSNCYRACAGMDGVIQLAADMGGMGFIETHKADCMLSVLITTHMLMAARDLGAERLFYSSSACVYNAEKQKTEDVEPLKESDAYPALPEDGYGWEKLFTERMCRHFREDFSIETRVARYHNVYGPEGSWEGGREKAPAALSRKVVEAVVSGDHSIEIWGDGKQTRSFMFIDDCIEGTLRLTCSDVVEPLNVGSDELVTVNQVVDILEEVAGITLKRNYNLDAPRGVNGRNSDNTLIKQRLGWAPSIRLRDGLEKTYKWIYDEYVKKYGGKLGPREVAPKGAHVREKETTAAAG